jgi:hypothetical protein
MNRLAYPIVILAVTLAGCADPVDPPIDPVKDRPHDPPPIELRIVHVSGDAQEARPGSELATPLQVHVWNQDHEPVAGARVSWFIATGAGTFRPSASAETTVGGTASVYFTPLSEAATVVAEIGSHTARFRVLPRPAAVFGSATDGYRFFADGTVVAIQNGFRYPGHFSRIGPLLYLDIAGRSASGTLSAESLGVDYDWSAEFDGFQDGDFPLDRAGSAAADEFLDGMLDGTVVPIDGSVGLVAGIRR